MSQSRPNLKTIFLEALNCSDGADRAAYLEKVCGRASTIRSRIDALLLAHDAAGGFDEATSGSEATPTRHIDLERAATGGSPPSVTRARDATSTFDADETSAPLSLRPIGTPPRLDRDESVFAGPGECDVNAVRAELRGETSQFVDRWHVGIAALTCLPILCLGRGSERDHPPAKFAFFGSHARLSVGETRVPGTPYRQLSAVPRRRAEEIRASTLRYRRLAACGEFCHKPVEAVMMLHEAHVLGRGKSDCFRSRYVAGDEFTGFRQRRRIFVADNHECWYGDARQRTRCIVRDHAEHSAQGRRGACGVKMTSVTRESSYHRDSK